MMRQLSRHLFLLLFTFAGIELLSFGFFHAFKDRFTFHDLDLYRLDADQIEQAAQKYEPRLGWSNHYQTPLGERPVPKVYDNALVSSYGDSYTYCAEVEDADTWQVDLSKRLGMGIRNFGVGGYGTGQAYLRFHDEFHESPTRIATLGLITENINRIVNVYRPYYFPHTQLPFSKPRFLLQDGELLLQENPVRTASELDRLSNTTFLRKLGRHDWWYNRDNYPELRFPYGAILFNKRMWAEAIYGKVVEPINDVNPRPWEALWREREARQLMFALFDQFTAEARQLGAVPLILVFPQREDVTEYLRIGRRADDLVRIMDYCQSANLYCLELISLFAEHVDPEKPSTLNRLFMRAHVSPIGNKFIAGGIANWIRSQHEEFGEFR
jgi:hypothetical protein